MPEPRTSIVVPTLHDASLAATLRAVAAEIGPRTDVELIVAGLDRDENHRAVKAVRFVDTGERVYPGAARNAGAAEAQGRNLVFVDSDCLPQAGWLAALEAALAREPCGVGGAVAFEPDGYWSEADNVALFHEFLATRPPARRRYLASLNFAIDRTLFERHGGFDPTLRSAEDLDLTARLDRAGVPLYFEPRAVVRHRPSRRTAGGVWRHHFTYGANSARVRLRYPDVLAAPSILRSRALMAILSPTIATLTTARIFLREPGTLPYLRTAPAVFLTKLAWCWSVAASRRPGMPR
jgi:GT2 family glycosyltransferase